MRLAVLVLVVMIGLSPGPAAAAPTQAVELVSHVSPERVVAQQTQLEYYGVLRTADTHVGLPGMVFDLAIVPDIGPVQTVKVTTGTAGTWAYHARQLYSSTVRSYFPGTTAYGPVFARSYRAPVSPRILVTSPPFGARSSTAGPLVVSGSVLPAKPGVAMGLYRFDGSRFVAVTTCVATATGFLFRTSLPAGSYTLKVGIGRTPGNWLGYSSATSVIRQ